MVWKGKKSLMKGNLTVQKCEFRYMITTLRLNEPLNIVLFIKEGKYVTGKLALLQLNNEGMCLKVILGLVVMSSQGIRENGVKPERRAQGSHG
jgi:hypothetical protein